MPRRLLYFFFFFNEPAPPKTPPLPHPAPLPTPPPRRGRIPSDAMARIRQTARVDVARILAIQERVKHEMIALLTSLEEQLGPDSRFVHIGLTTSDVWDTATALQLRDAADLLIAGQERLERALRALALRHKDT